MKNKYIQELMSENEQVFYYSRQHILVLIQRLLPEFFTFVLAVVIISIIWVNFLTNSIILLSYFVLIFPVISAIRDYLIWRNHQYVITNKRVIQIMGVFAKNVIDSSLEKVNDVKLRQSFFGRIFNFGDIEILTASEFGVNRFLMINNPVAFKKEMMKAKEF